MKNQEFKVKMNQAVLYFEVLYALIFVINIINKKYQDALVIGFMGVFIYGYLILLRPYKYKIDRKLLIIYKRIGKPKEINLMNCETICDVIPKFTRILTRPHALELYTDKKKRTLLVPKDKVKFTSAILSANKRIHCQVKEYAENNKSFAKRQRRERKQLEKETTSDTK